LAPTNLAIDKGDYLTITGPSGSGKSTLLNLFGLLDRPTTGDYFIRGVTVRALDTVTTAAIRGQLFGFVFQAYHLLAGRSALENVEIGMLYGPFAPRARRRRAAAALDRVGLAHRTHALPRQLSGGERQRVAIARSVACGPQVLFCDEPTGNLDSANSHNVMSLLSDLNAEGLTLVVVTHDPTVASLSRRLVTVADGVVSEQ
jgi:putative ABC transport system ATP-binding protein